jgi:hypothetical protein
MARDESLPVIALSEWTSKLRECDVSDTVINSLISDYLVCTGFKDAAYAFAEEAGVPLDADSDPRLASLEARDRLRQLMLSGDVDAAFDLILELAPGALDTEHTLLQHLHELRFITLIRNGDYEAALVYARDEMSPHAASHAHLLPQLERVLGLLAFPDPANSPLAFLLSPAYAEEIAAEANRVVLERTPGATQDGSPQLSYLLRLLFAAEDELGKHAKFPRLASLLTGVLTEPQ